MGSLDWLRVTARYEGVAGRAVRNLKFQRHMELARPIGELMKPLVADAPEFDAVAPVPIHWSRLSVRGFNQANCLARAMGLAPISLLVRVKPTRPQTQISGRERLVNLEHALRSRCEARGLRVLVVDDVVTSGSTMEACASALKSAGASWVGGVAFAKTQVRT
jgi:ComF family protein